jgi:hypothetical protein
MSAVDYPEDVRPRTRGECVNGPRPCPWVSCRQNLFLDVGKGGKRLLLNFPGREPGELQHSCALDVAELGGLTLEGVGEIFGVSREYVRQIQRAAYDRMLDARTLRILDMAP